MSANYKIPSDFYVLRAERVNALIREQGLKKWWVAEEAGVHKTTLRRWLSGRIGKVRRHNVESLARVLTSPPSLLAAPVEILPYVSTRLTANGGTSGHTLD